MKELTIQDKYRILLDLVKDIAEYGFRADTTPTLGGRIKMDLKQPWNTVQDFYNYIGDINNNLKTRCYRKLQEIGVQPNDREDAKTTEA